MVSKVIQLPYKRKHNLSRLMIIALVEASVKQSRGILFGPVDIKGSFSSLLRRDLIIRKETNAGADKAQSVWHVTDEGMEILKSIGVDIFADNDVV